MRSHPASPQGAVDHHLTFEPAPAPNGAVPTNIALEGDCLQVLRGLPDDCIDAEPYPIDHTCAPRPDSQTTPAPWAHIEHELTRGEVSERSIEAVLKHARMT